MDARRLSTASRLSAGGRPAGGDREAGRGPRRRPRAPDAARRDRLGQDLHHRQRDPAGAAADAGDGAQQDAGGAALRRVQGVLPATTRSSTSSPTTTTTSPRPTSRRRDTYIEKDASINEHIEQMRLSATKALLERTRLDHRRDGVGDLRPRRSRGLPAAWCCTWCAASASTSASCCAAWPRCSTRATSSTCARGTLPRARRRHRHLPGRVRARGGARRAVRRRDRDAGAVRSADRRGAAQGAALHGLSGVALRDAAGAR